MCDVWSSEPLLGDESAEAEAHPAEKNAPGRAPLAAGLDVRVIDETRVTLRPSELDPSVDQQGRVREFV